MSGTSTGNKDNRISLSYILAKTLGLNKKLSNRIVELIGFYIIQSLIKAGTVFIEGLGEIYTTRTKSKALLFHFRPTDITRRKITSGSNDYIKILENSYKDLEIDKPFVADTLDDAEFRADDKQLKLFKRRDIIRESLFLYLQRDFPYDYPWTHPATKKVYSSVRFKAAIRVARSYYEEGYECFYAIWICFSKKDHYIRKLGISEQEFIQKAEKTLDLILQLVVNEDLEPSRMNNLFNLSHYIYTK